MRELYQVLGVAKGASARELKRAYYDLAHRYHPDKIDADARQGALAIADDVDTGARFREAVFAYEVLSDPQVRPAYDRFGMLGVHAVRGTAPRGPEDLGPRAERVLRFVQRVTRHARTRLAEVQRVRQQARRRARAEAQGQARGADVEVQQDATLEVLLCGGRCSIALPTYVTCAACRGSGWSDGRRPPRCTGCRGAGELILAVGGAELRPGCPYCDGTGVGAGLGCGACEGLGARGEPQERTLRVPAGCGPGTPLRVAGGGPPGPRGGPPGDLWLRLVLRPSPTLWAEGGDVHLRHPVAAGAANEGEAVHVAWPTGPVALTVPRGGAQDIARTVRVPNAGLFRGDGSRGALVVTLVPQAD